MQDCRNRDQPQTCAQTAIRDDFLSSGNGLVHRAHDFSKKLASQASESKGSPRTEQGRIQRLLQPACWSVGRAPGADSTLRNKEARCDCDKWEPQSSLLEQTSALRGHQLCWRGLHDLGQALTDLELFTASALHNPKDRHLSAHKVSQGLAHVGDYSVSLDGWPSAVKITFALSNQILYFPDRFCLIKLPKLEESFLSSLSGKLPGGTPPELGPAHESQGPHLP